MSKGDKWEAYFISSSGYGRKRRRVGGVFDTREEAARAYSTECRAILQQQMADEANGATTSAGQSAMGGGEAYVEAESDSEVEEADTLGAGDSLAADEYEVEEIVGERRARLQGNAWRTEYEVKWRGYPGTTWEPHEHLKVDCCAHVPLACIYRITRRATSASSF